MKTEHVQSAATKRQAVEPAPKHRSFFRYLIDGIVMQASTVRCKENGASLSTLFKWLSQKHGVSTS